MVKRDPTAYPLIDSDPHFWRVCRYMRPVDYGVWAAFTVSGPAFTWWTRKYNPIFRAKSTAFGSYGLTFVGMTVLGFMAAYQDSALRFYGAKENNRELIRDWEEMRERIKKQEEPLYGYTRLSEYGQSVVMRMTTNAAWGLWLYPVFNVTNHKFHDTDQDYYKGLEHLKPPGYRTTFIGAE